MAVMRAVAFACLLASVGARKSRPKPSDDCIVTSTFEDGRQESRDCFIMSEEEMEPGTHGRFESCTT